MSNRKGGFTIPTNPAAALQQMIVDEKSETNAQTGDKMKLTSNEVLKQPTKETVKLQSNVATNETTHIDTQLPVNKSTNTAIQETTLEDWLESILERAKLQVEDGKTARLNIEVDESMHFELKRFCLERRITVRRLMNELVAAYLRDARK